MILFVAAQLIINIPDIHNVGCGQFCFLLFLCSQVERRSKHTAHAEYGHISWDNTSFSWRTYGDMGEILWLGLGTLGIALVSWTKEDTPTNHILAFRHTTII